MVKAFQFRRLVFLASLLVLIFCGLAYRLVDLQVLRHEELQAKARTNTQRTMTMEPRRGEIRDIRGNLLATVLPVKTLCADPTLITNRYPEMARILAPLLKTNENYLLERLQPRVVRHTTNGEPVYDKHVILKHRVKVEDWELVQKALAVENFGIETNQIKKAEKTFLRNLREKAIFSEEDQMRIYPNKALAAHVLGFVGIGDQGTEIVGKDGIELVLNSKLSGVRGWRQTEKDNRGRELVALRQQDVEPRDGLNVVLSLDAGIQHIVETELAEAMLKHTPISISCTVIRPKTGEILAMASLPNFDPNSPGASPANLKNRIISDLAEPGSTFKIVVVSGALNDQTVTLTDKFDCEHGHFTYAGRVLHDHESYGILSVENIITKSSNIGSAKIGIKMGEASLYQYIRNYGFGERTGVYLPGEVSGIVHMIKNPKNPSIQWTKLSISRIPMGHEVAVTPLQMVMAMSAIANGGRLMKPMIVDRLEDELGRAVVKCQPQMVRQVVQPQAAKEMVQALKTVVGADGTAPKAKLDLYTVAGKTGTAQKVINGVYAPGKYFSSFIGFFPADNPELCISVVMDEPKQGGHYGGQTAAPVFHDIAVRAANYLNITPEVPTTPILPESPVGLSNPPVILQTAHNN